ncbi:hypothetical protein WQ54_19345 [Bacillus sp. SA1-12]|uniref:hypothetical protein n=1 Tax=Bacillus sp. SA1-12 TaxID=1455638 RepID=UPI000626F91E|nr:hypothetical protein [Bacillus sp. SA1-12]KKI90677.1 hypothetical protein WQ54_19345 [Bacillus sp. SA1-12]
MRKHEEDYNGKWKKLGFIANINKNLYHFLQETTLNIADLRRLAKDRDYMETLRAELANLNVKMEGSYGNFDLFDLDNYVEEIKEKELSVINKFIYYVKRNKEIQLNIFQPVVNYHGTHVSSKVDFGVSELKFAELLEKYHDIILKKGIEVKAGSLTEYKTYYYNK